MISDRHLHTWFSEDSAQDPEACILRAAALGMKEITFTDHYDMDFPDGRFLFDPDAYFRDLQALKQKYAGQIEVQIGVELGLKPDLNEKIRALLAAYPFDYVIGSIHLMDEKDPYERHLFDMSDEAFYRMYFETALTCLKACSGFQTFGHLDYVVRYGYEKDRTYSVAANADVIDAILLELIRRGIALEINTAGLRKGLAYPHPYPDVMRRFRELGGTRLALGSDAHQAEDIGAGFETALSYLRSFGFGEENLTVMRNKC